MMRTIPLKLILVPDQMTQALSLQNAFSEACNEMVPYVIENRCWNRVDLHHLVYKETRNKSSLGSQMVCNAIYSVCKAYKSQALLGRINKDKPVQELSFRKGSVHFDKRTYSFTKTGQLSLYTLSGRMKVDFVMGERQKELFLNGKPKEGELVCRKGEWYFNLVLELPDVPKVERKIVMGVDVGENNLAATSTGKIFGGEALRDRRDRFLARRKRLQSNGSQSARKALCKASGKESRYVKHVNHEVSKAIITEASRAGASCIVLEDLTDIRDSIRGSKRIRSRLHRWPFRQLQEMIFYKAENVGMEVVRVNPAYTSCTCADCLSLGQREKHQFRCFSCGLRAHADCNASRNLARIITSADVIRAEVSRPNVGTTCVP